MIIDIADFLKKNSIDRTLRDYKTIYGNKASHEINNGYSCHINMMTYEIVIGVSMLLKFLIDSDVFQENVCRSDAGYYLSDKLLLRNTGIPNSMLKKDKSTIARYLPPLIEGAFIHELSHKAHTILESSESFSSGMGRLIVHKCVNETKRVSKDKEKVLQVYVARYFSGIDNCIDDGRIEYLEGKDNTFKNTLFNFMRNCWKKKNVPHFNDDEKPQEKLNNIAGLFCYIATIGKIPASVKSFDFYRAIGEDYFNTIREAVTCESHDKYLIILTKKIKETIDLWVDIFVDIASQIPEGQSTDEAIEYANVIFHSVPSQSSIPQNNQRDKKEQQELDDLFPEEDGEDNKPESIPENLGNDEEKVTSEENDTFSGENSQSDNKSNGSVKSKQKSKEDEKIEGSDSDELDNDIYDDSKSSKNSFDDLLNSYSEVGEYIPKDDEIINQEIDFSQKEERINTFKSNAQVDGFSNYLGHRVNVVEFYIKRTPSPFMSSLRDIVAIEKKKRKVNNRREGLLDINRVVDVAVGHKEDVFSKNQGKNMDICIEILIDRSGSMGVNFDENISKMDQAIVACEVVEKITMYIPTQIVYFDDDFYKENDLDSGREVVRLQIIKEFDERSNDSFVEGCKLNAGGGNSDGVAIRACVNHLKNRKERKKILIVISDGEPCGIAYPYSSDTGYKDVKNATNYAIQSGVIVIPIAIMNLDYMDSYTRNTTEKNYTFMYGSIIMCNPRSLGNILYDILHPLC